MKKKIENYSVDKRVKKNQHASSKTRVRELAHIIYQERSGIDFTGDAASDWYNVEEELYR